MKCSTNPNVQIRFGVQESVFHQVEGTRLESSKKEGGLCGFEDGEASGGTELRQSFVEGQAEEECKRGWRGEVGGRLSKCCWEEKQGARAARILRATTNTPTAKHYSPLN